MFDQWFAWRPVRTSNGIVWLDWIWRYRDGDRVRYFSSVFIE